RVGDSRLLWLQLIPGAARGRFGGAIEAAGLPADDLDIAGGIGAAVVAAGHIDQA
ncbi:MAG: hypothetical protein ACI9K5_000921, partial [Gammaproteobacteria bacterium]